MEIIDLTHTLAESMPVYPGTEPPSIQISNTIEVDGFVETKLTMYSHTGTHMDAPSHMQKAGLSLNQFAISHFLGHAVIVDFTNIKNEKIPLEALQKYEPVIATADYVLLKTGWSDHWGEEHYFKDFPVLSVEAATWLTTFNLKGIGVDTISVDRMGSDSFPIHQIILAKGLVIIENLNNLHLITKARFLFSCLPLKFSDADGSPVRAVAIW